MVVAVRNDPQAVTFVSAGASEVSRWNANASTGHYRVANDIDQLESLLREYFFMRKRGTVRVVIDGGIDLDRFLIFVALLPEEFQGELLYVRADGSGYLSTRELGTERYVKAIAALDVEVYLRWHGLPARARDSYH